MLGSRRTWYDIWTTSHDPREQAVPARLPPPREGERARHHGERPEDADRQAVALRLLKKKIFYGENGKADAPMQGPPSPGERRKLKKMRAMVECGVMTHGGRASRISRGGDRSPVSTRTVPSSRWTRLPGPIQNMEDLPVTFTTDQYYPDPARGGFSLEDKWKRTRRSARMAEIAAPKSFFLECFDYRAITHADGALSDEEYAETEAEAPAVARQDQ